MIKERREYWLEKFVGEAKGGIYFRNLDIKKFIAKVEEHHGKVVGIIFDETNNMEFIYESKETKQ